MRLMKVRPYATMVRRQLTEDSMSAVDIRQTAVADILRTLRNLKAEARGRFKAELKGIFGSYARSEAKAGSDLDVLVEFDAGANLLDLVGLSLYLEERLGCPVDVVPESALRPELRSGILQETISL